MATFTKRPSGKWQAKIRRQGHPPKSRTFDKKFDAEAWARATEREMDRGLFLSGDAAHKTCLSIVLEKYAREIFPSLSGEGKYLKANLDRINASLGNLTLANLDSSHISKFRDQCLQAGLAPQTVKHALGLLNRVLKCCESDWGITLPRGLPTALVRKPKLPKGRDRRLKPDEERTLLAAAQEYGGEIADIILFALETASRRTEIASMRWEHIDWNKRVLFLPQTKSGAPRYVPLSSASIEILKPRRNDIGNVWNMRPDSITRAFTRICIRAKLEDLHFHDLRHEATSRLFEKKLNMMEVASITGYKTLEMLKRYAHLKPENLVDKLG